MAASAIGRLTVHPLRIPLRQKVTHATSTRSVSDPVVVAVELIGGSIGYGETLARPYVTGETVESVVQAIQEVLAPLLLDFRPEHFPGALEAIDALPFEAPDGSAIPAARAAVELALLDVYARHFDRPISEIAGWMGLVGFGEPGSCRTLRYSGVLASESLEGTIKTLRLLWWYGIKNFKLKVGLADDADRLGAVLGKIGRSIERGRATLRVDANGVWNREQAIEQMAHLRKLPLAGIEQPLVKGAEDDLPIVHDLAEAPLIYDESLVTLADAQRLVELGVADGFNIRISKCGGLLPALRLAELAYRHGALVQLGCMVGETSILSAAGRRFLEMVPRVAFAEGWAGSFLSREDVVRRPLRFGYGGRGRPLGTRGLGVEVEPARLCRLRDGEAVTLVF